MLNSWTLIYSEDGIFTTSLPTIAKLLKVSHNVLTSLQWSHWCIIKSNRKTVENSTNIYVVRDYKVPPQLPLELVVCTAITSPRTTFWAFCSDYCPVTSFCSHLYTQTDAHWGQSSQQSGSWAKSWKLRLYEYRLWSWQNKKLAAKLTNSIALIVSAVYFACWCGPFFRQMHAAL